MHAKGRENDPSSNRGPESFGAAFAGFGGPKSRRVGVDRNHPVRPGPMDDRFGRSAGMREGGPFPSRDGPSPGAGP